MLDVLTILDVLTLKRSPLLAASLHFLSNSIVLRTDAFVLLLGSLDLSLLVLEFSFLDLTFLIQVLNFRVHTFRIFLGLEKMKLSTNRTQTRELSLLSEKFLCFGLGSLEFVSRFLQSYSFLKHQKTFVLKLFHLTRSLLDRFHIRVRSNNVFQILQHTNIILILCLGFHQRNLLDLTLKNQETIVVQIDTFFFQKSRDISKITLLGINDVMRLVVLECFSSHNKLTVRNNIETVLVSLAIYDLLKVNRYRAFLAVRMKRTVVNQLRHFLQSKFRCSSTKNKKHRIDDLEKKKKVIRVFFERE